MQAVVNIVVIQWCIQEGESQQASRGVRDLLVVANFSQRGWSYHHQQFAVMMLAKMSICVLCMPYCEHRKPG